jgi:hypothetical protein
LNRLEFSSPPLYPSFFLLASATTWNGTKRFIDKRWLLRLGKRGAAALICKNLLRRMAAASLRSLLNAHCATCGQETPQQVAVAQLSSTCSVSILVMRRLGSFSLICI